MFITVEGGDGAGKSTLVAKTAAYFRARGREITTTHAPGGTLIGQKIRTLLLEESMTPEAELFLFLADRVEQLDRVIRPALAAGHVVLCDRFNDSTIAYQGEGRHLGLTWVEGLCQEACRQTVPDITFFLDIDPEAGRKRLQRPWDRLEQEEIAFHHRVHEGFLWLAKKHSDRIYTIDASQSAEAVFEKAIKFLESHV